MTNTDAATEMNAVKQKLLGAVGLAAKARKCVFGTTLCVETMRGDKGELLICASDVSENTRARLTKTARFHKIPYTIPGVTKEELTKFAGKKSDTAAILLTDKGFVKIIEKLGIEIHTTDTEVLE